MPELGIFGWVLIGLLAGAIAGAFVPGRQRYGCLGTMAIGIIGGLIGLTLGWVVVLLANDLGRSSGTVLFDLTPGTAVFAVAFSTILGMVAGLIPAWSAARLDPVAALRYE